MPKIIKTARLLRLGSARRDAGQSYVIKLPKDVPEGDSVAHPEVSTARLFENGKEIGPPHAFHSEIRDKGLGRFSHWGRRLYLSSTDGTPVSANGYNYDLLIEPQSEALVAELRAAAVQVPWLGDDHKRFELAERLFHLLVPQNKVSEFGRTYFDDADFAAFYERFGEGNYRAYDRRWTVGQLAGHAAGLAGAFAECGVYRGATAWLMARAVARQGKPGRKVHLFDSFAGLSRPATEDGSYWHEGDMCANQEEVRARLVEWSDSIVMHPGWIPSRFADVANDRFAFVHIDLDLCQPTCDSLKFFYERMTPGGILLCDDYGFSSCPGARKAMDEFFAGRTEKIIHLPTGQGLVVIAGRRS